MKKHIEVICGAVVLLSPFMMSTEAVAQDGFTAITPCRVMDTRFMDPTEVDCVEGDVCYDVNADPQNTKIVTESWEIPGQRALAVSLSNQDLDVPLQGGDPDGCPAVPGDATAYVVTLSAFREGYVNFSDLNYATLIPYDINAWTDDSTLTDPDAPLGPPPVGTANTLWKFTDGTFQAAASLTVDGSTGLIANTTTVQNCGTVCDFSVLLFTSTTSHYTIDVVGYYTAP